MKILNTLNSDTRQFLIDRSETNPEKSQIDIFLMMIIVSPVLCTMLLYVITFGTGQPWAFLLLVVIFSIVLYIGRSMDINRITSISFVTSRYLFGAFAYKWDTSNIKTVFYQIVSAFGGMAFILSPAIFILKMLFHDHHFGG